MNVFNAFRNIAQVGNEFLVKAMVQEGMSVHF